MSQMEIETQLLARQPFLVHTVGAERQPSDRRVRSVVRPQVAGGKYHQSIRELLPTDWSQHRALQ